MSKPRNRIYRYIYRRDTGERLFDVGLLKDGTLHNPRGYPDDVVRATIEYALERGRQARSEAAKKAAITRARRIERRTHQAAEQMLKGLGFTAARLCRICRKGVTDSASIARGIGSDCWQNVLQIVHRAREQDSPLFAGPPQ